MDFAVVAGVEEVKVDGGGNKITVIGKVDPVKLREKLEEKTKKKVELISPVPKKDAKDGGADKKSDAKDGAAEKKSDEKVEKKADDKKPKEVPFLTCALPAPRYHAPVAAMMSHSPRKRRTQRMLSMCCSGLYPLGILLINLINLLFLFLRSVSLR